MADDGSYPVVHTLTWECPSYQLHRTEYLRAKMIPTAAASLAGLHPVRKSSVELTRVSPSIETIQLQFPGLKRCLAQ
jgi:hypothetical protein